MDIARNVEVWIFGAFAGLVIAACLSGPSEPGAPTASAAVAMEQAGQPPADQPMHVVYVTGKRLSAAEKRLSAAEKRALDVPAG